PLATITPTPAPNGCPCTIWPNTAIPTNLATSDSSAVELGVKFRVDTDGYVIGVRFYKDGTNLGTHIANLWTTTGTRLATSIFAGEIPHGWQRQDFSSPVPVMANTTYVASYFAPQGHYSADQGYFGVGFDRGPLHALANGISGGNGVY